MFPIECVKYINLPKIPNKVLDTLVVEEDIELYAREYGYAHSNGMCIDHGYEHSFVHSNNTKQTYESLSTVNDWCRKHICTQIYFSYHVIYNNFIMHKDNNTKSKLMYVVETGGADTVTRFYEDDKKTEKFNIKIEPFRWCILEADVYHEVTDMDKDTRRLAIVGQIFKKVL